MYSPLNALRSGRWFKLICGASFQHLPAVRSLALAYTLAGADCIDVAADPAVVMAVQEALDAAQTLVKAKSLPGVELSQRPWLMVSLNDGEDPHFRKAEFDATECPAHCPRPCERVCPAEAIAFRDTGGESSGVIDDRCYGCGRCLPVCPSQLIFTRSYVYRPTAIAASIFSLGIDAIEIHTQPGRFADFQRLWKSLAPGVARLKLLAISCPDGPDLIDYLRALYDLISPLRCPLVWQTDGRPMSGDIGKGATQATIKLAQKVLAANLPGWVQLAGGTNQYTVAKLQAEQLLGKPATKNPFIPLQSPSIAGVAYGSYARSLLLPIINQLEHQNDKNPTQSDLENSPELLAQAVEIARSLVAQIKGLDSKANNPISRVS